MPQLCLTQEVPQTFVGTRCSIGLSLPISYFSKALTTLFFPISPLLNVLPHEFLLIQSSLAFSKF